MRNSNSIDTKGYNIIVKCFLLYQKEWDRNSSLDTKYSPPSEYIWKKFLKGFIFFRNKG